MTTTRTTEAEHMRLLASSYTPRPALTRTPVGDWADGLDTLPPTVAEHRARSASLTPAPVRPRRSAAYRRTRSAVQALSVLLFGAVMLLAGAAVQAHQWGAVLAAGVALSLAAGAVMIGGRR
jgi:hypothetical protein